MRFPTPPWIVLAILGLWAVEVKGQEIHLISSLSVQQEFNDNLFFETKDREMDFLTRVSAGSELVERTERLDLRLAGRSELLLYARNTDLDALNHLYKGSLSYRLSPRAKVSLDAGYLQDNSPDRDVATTGLLLNAATRQRFTGSIWGDYALSEKLFAGASYSWEQEIFSDPQLSDNQAHSFGFGLGRDLADWLPNTQGRMNLGYARYLSESSAVESFSWTLGAGHDLTERLKLSVDAGMRHSIFRFEVQSLEFVPSPGFFRVVSEKHEKSSPGGLLKLGLSYRWERTNAAVGFQNDLMTASGRQGPTERTGLTFDMEHRFMERLWGRLNASFFLNRAKAGEFGAQEIEEQAFTLRPSIGWEISEKFLLEASYTFSQVHDLARAATKSRNLASIRLSFRHDLLKR
jgi:hypothetical protein